MEYELLFEFVIKIGLSVLLGSLIGIEREKSQHPAGLRTMILVCLGSTLFMFVPYYVINDTFLGSNVNLDITRVAAGVITGIGFLGAGVIFKAGANVHGLTTAASIWIASSVGLLVAIGFYMLAIIATIVIVMVLHFFHTIERDYFKYDLYSTLKIKIRYGRKVKQRIEQVLRRSEILISLNDFSKTDDGLLLVYTTQLPRNLKKDLVTNKLLKDPELIELTWSK